MATAALLMGCSSGDSTPTTVTVTESPSTPTPEEGDQDAPTEASLFSQQFHPCEAFTEEQLQKAGLGKQSNAAENPESVVRSCGFGFTGKNEASGNLLLATDKMNWQEVSDLNLDPEYWSGIQVDGLYTHKMPGNTRNCIAAVDLEWGRFMASYLEFGDGWDRRDLCTGPVFVLESLIKQSGGINGT
ncbi:DUF3558 domain-containing protein [uncultured Corynebacterium sp.]|uniref:DUF3558 domain-containing protein n=1 Tax=uncultured Corynebacterium sp. TaxID=159447 RepID=UPI0025CFFB30|nr:DUF3558 domain-containing protein [uncultured Corynebacterium sp.]